MTDGVSIFGIRHHGPGSARSVIRALELLEPEVLLVEGPPDAQALLPLVAAEGMRPPVALVVYPHERLGTGVFYPFASFSPEWNALRYALRIGIPARFCDLPQAISLAGSETPDPQDQQDPVRLLAQAAGEDDPERWWERLVEQRTDDADVFHAITEAMGSVRDTLPPPSLHELRREAHMRQAIRRARTEGFARIAVVCGAWHAPALETLLPSRNDAALLRGLKRIKVDATWVPWTASRLGYASGYGAGVESPAWYRHLWDTNGDLTAWLSSAARLLRAEDLDASASQVVDAVRLAEALAALRGRPQPSLTEVSEATLAVLCGGEPERLSLIHKKLVVGEEMGALAEGVPPIPLQRDLDAHARRLRLRADPEERLLDLDLRQPHQLEQSRFLHRLAILGIDWGRAQPLPYGKLGTFHELWSLRWQPEVVLQVLAAGVYGNTVVDAATRRAVERGEATGRGDLGRLAALIDVALLADLDAALPSLVSLLSMRSAESTDVSQMLQALPPLASTLRYGDVRRTTTATLAPVVLGIGERVTVGLGPACSGLDDEAAQQLAGEIVAATRAISVLSEEPAASLVDDWWRALHEVLGRRDLADLVGGTCTRLLLSAERMDATEAAERMARALARGTDPAAAARWIEGFLHTGGGPIVLATSARLFALVDDWLAALPDDYFAQVLPLLRRTTATFSNGERRQIAERVRSGNASALLLGSVDDIDPARAALVEPIVLAILGVGDG